MEETSSSDCEHTSSLDEDVFEINDFTNQTDWESFISQIVEVLTQWQLNNYIKFIPLSSDELANGEWETLSANIKFSSVSFDLSLHRLKQKEDTEQFMEESKNDFHLPQYADDMMNKENDFPPRAHCLARWYGLRCFLVLCPVDSNVLINSSKASLLTSSANIALFNTSCDIPMFIQIKESWQRLYTGSAISPGVMTNFDIASLKQTPVQYSNLSGLMYIFKSNFKECNLASDKIHVSARYTYSLQDWENQKQWPIANKTTNQFYCLPQGCLNDPIVQLKLAACWPSITGDQIIDNDVYKGFNPLTAPKWFLRLQYADDIRCLLTTCLSELVKILSSTASMSDLINFIAPNPDEKDIGHALDRISDPTKILSPIVSPKLAEGISKVVSNSQSFIKRGAVSIGRMAVAGERIDPKLMTDIKEFLFSTDDNDQDEMMSSNLSYTQIKAAPVGSFTYRLAVCVAVLNLYHGGLWAIAQLWHVVMTELRTFLDLGKCLPRLSTSKVDYRSCLLHQKLQLLNCCISRRTTRERYKDVKDEDVSSEKFEHDSDPNEASSEDQLVSVESSKRQTSNDTFDTAAELDTSNRSEIFSDDSDEFFECDDTFDSASVEVKSDDVDSIQKNSPEIKQEDKKVTNISEETSKVAADTTNLTTPPKGRLHQLQDLKLLHVDAPLYVPVTQEQVLLTEDQLEEQAKLFSSLGDTQEGSKVRAKMQTASLQADMSAFKAANPGCVLEDFVRWYSPRDFVQGALSARMSLSDNLWITTWNSSPSIPARKQKRIFDDTKEAEKVLHFLANLNPATLAQLMLPICFYDALIQLQSHSKSMSRLLPTLPPLCDQLEQKASRLFSSWNAEASSIAPELNDFLRHIGFAESWIERSRSILHKFSEVKDLNELDNFVQLLLEQPEVELKGSANGEVGKIVQKFFFAQEQKKADEVGKNETPSPRQTLPDPAGREFIFRTEVQHPSPNSRKLPQRMYAVLTYGEFRLVSALCRDSTFF